MKIGDKVKKVTDALGIPQCGGCKERQAALNRLGDWLSSVVGRNGDPQVLSNDARSIPADGQQERLEAPAHADAVLGMDRSTD